MNSAETTVFLCRVETMNIEVKIENKEKWKSILIYMMQKLIYTKG